MSMHLSSEQISGWIAGDRTPAAEQHLRECRQCAEETERLAALFAEFRSSAIEWSLLQKEDEAPRQWTPSKQRGGFFGRVLRWKLAAAAIAIMLVFPICKTLNDRQRGAELLKADAQLLEEISNQISRPVPASLEPLMDLIAWESDATEKQ